MADMYYTKINDHESISINIFSRHPQYKERAANYTISSALRLNSRHYSGHMDLENLASLKELRDLINKTISDEEKRIAPKQKGTPTKTNRFSEIDLV